MNRRLLLVAFLSTFALTVLAAGHQLTNAAPNMAPPPQHAPRIDAPPVQAWKVVAGGGGKDAVLTDVSMSSSTDGWAVGLTGPSSYGVLMHYNGSAWSRQTVPTGTYSLRAVKMTSSTAGWAVGYNACSDPCDSALLMRYTNSAWKKIAVPAPGNTTGYSDIDIKGNAGWAIGDGWALKFNGANWTPVSLSSDGYSAVSVIDGNDAWAVGSSRQALHYTGGNWLPTSLGLNSLPPTLTVRMRSIHMLNASEGWAVGYATSGSLNQCLLVHRTSTWYNVTCPFYNYRLHAVQMRTATDVWAVGNDRSTGTGVALHYNGASWTSVPLPSGTPTLYSLQLPGANDGWIVGGKGTILRLVNGVWTRMQGSDLPIGPINAPDAYTRPIDATDANTVWWYGGIPGQLYRWRNGTVTHYTTPITGDLYALDMVSSTLGWAGTASLQGPNYLLRYSSGTWTTWPMANTVDAIAMIGPAEGWIASGSGFHYLNGALIPDSLPGTIISFSMLDSQHGWAVGPGGDVYSYTTGIWAMVTPRLNVPYANLRIIGINPAEAWVAGYSTSCDPSGCPATPELHHFSGGAWTNIISPTSQLPGEWLAFFDISKVSATEWWAAGKLKTLEYAFLHYKTGSYTTVPAVEDVKAVSMLPDGHGFASGVGSVLRLIDLPNKVYLPLIRR